MHIAQVNVARMRAPLDDPLLAGFIERLDEINELADVAPGFKWRLQTENGNATAIRAYDDDRTLFNLSVWRSLEDLERFVFRTAHAEVMRKRSEWMERPAEEHLALWWVVEGHIPSVQEAKQRLDMLRRAGPSVDAFTFQRRFDPTP